MKTILSYGDPDPSGDLSKKIVGAIDALTAPPPIEIDSGGNVVAHLPSLGNVRLEAIKDVLIANEGLARRVEQKIGLGWILISARRDPANVGLAAFALDELRNRQWVSASTLYRLLIEKSEIKPTEPASHTTERIFRVLAAVAQALRARLPSAAKLEGSGVLVLYEKEEGTYEGIWQGSKEPIDMLELVAEQSRVSGGITGETAATLSTVLVKELLSGEMTLPGFSRRNGSGGASLSWTRPALTG